MSTKRYLVDTKIWLERLLDQKQDYTRLIINIREFDLDFDDAYQLTISQKYDLTIVTFDKDFNAKGINKVRPEEVKKEKEKMKLLENKNTLITGASRGIGKAIATAFADHGANVAFTYLSSTKDAEYLEKELSAKGIKAKAYQSDAADYTSAEKLVNSIVEDFGGLEVVVNNAGITRDNLLLRMNEEDWDKVINTNLKSIFNISKFAIKPLMRSRKGSFIHISSIVGVQGNAGQANYAASKAGIIGFSKSLARELGSRNIRSNVITPGFIKTEMTDKLNEDTLKKWAENIPLKRAGDSEEVADLAVFLGSDMSAYITGQTISVCGGMLM